MSVQVNVPTNDEIERMSVEDMRRACWNLLSEFQLIKGALGKLEAQLSKENNRSAAMIKNVREQIGLSESI